MTILWVADQAAAQGFGYTLGTDVEVAANAPRVARVLEDEAGEVLVVIGPDIQIEEACTLAEAHRLTRPEVGIILLRHRLEVAVLAQALRSGIREVVQADDRVALADAAKRSRQLSAQLVDHSPGGPSRDGRVVTVFSAKGGVGKTTLSTNLAAYLASMNHRTLLIDLDLMFGDVAISLQLRPRSSIRDLVPMAGNIDRAGLDGVVTVHEASGLHVLSAPDNPADAERMPGHVVAEVIRVAKTQYDYVVIDTPPSFTEHVLASFDASDLTVLIATLDIPAVKNLRVAMSTLDALGIPDDLRCTVLNRSDTKVGLDADDVERALGSPIAISIPNSVSVPAATNRGVALVLSDPRSPVALAIRDLADTELRARFGEQLRTGTKKSFSLLRSRR